MYCKLNLQEIVKAVGDLRGCKLRIGDMKYACSYIWSDEQFLIQACQISSCMPTEGKGRI